MTLIFYYNKLNCFFTFLCMKKIYLNQNSIFFKKKRTFVAESNNFLKIEHKHLNCLKMILAEKYNKGII